MKTFKITITLVLLCAFVGCVKLTAAKVENSKAEPKPEPTLQLDPDLKPLWEEQHRDGALWTLYTLRELDRTPEKFLATVPSDLNLFCPNYANLNRDQRKYFWTFLISLMVRFESHFDPTSSYEESFNDSNGIPIVSRGLLQISFESSQGYDCGFSSAEQIHNPYLNLSCGLRILSRWFVADQSFAGYRANNWRGGARYWSVLRAGDKESYNTIVDRTRHLSLCKP